MKQKKGRFGFRDGNGGYDATRFGAAALAGIMFILGSGCSATSGNVEADRHKVASLVYQWAAAWENNIYSTDYYKIYYDPGFYSNYKSKSGMNYDQWMADKAAKGRKASCIFVEVSELNVSVSGDYAEARFMQFYYSDSYCDYGYKTLYFVRRGDTWKIIGEEQSSITKCDKRCSARGRDKQEIVVLINQWASAWENNTVSIDWYRSFYDRGFWSNYKSKSGMNYDQWMADKTAKGRKASCIWIYVSEIGVTIEGDFATAVFMQRYVSDSYCDYGYKTLYFIRSGGAWKIIGEEQPKVTKCNDRCY